MTLQTNEGVAYQPVVGASVMGPMCYLGIEENTPYGAMIDTSFNLRFTTINGVLSLSLNVSTWEPWFLHSIYFVGTSTALLKPYDGSGEEIFTDFFLAAGDSAEPFPLLTPYPFQPNDLLRFDVLDVAANLVEVCFRGYTLATDKGH